MNVVFVLLALVAVSQAASLFPHVHRAFPYHVELWGLGRYGWGSLLNNKTFITAATSSFLYGSFDKYNFEVSNINFDNDAAKDKTIGLVRVVKLKKPLRSSKALQSVSLPQRDFKVPFGSAIEFNITCRKEIIEDDGISSPALVQKPYITRLALKITKSCNGVTDDAKINANQFCAERVSITDEKPICSVFIGTPLVMDDGTAIGIIYRETDNNYSVASLVDIADSIKEIAHIE